MAGEPQRVPQRDEPLPSIAGYEMLEFIGRGSSGLVYRARQLAVDREVAIKILHPHLARESRIARRLQREARTTARLAHPHIVSAVDMGESDGRLWYAMELVDGPSLAQRLRAEGRIREREALRLFIPLCEALEHLWEHGVVHRDIKPANILIGRTGGARLADLGLAVAEDDPAITGTGGTLGTPHYISPEQAVDPRKADVRSDIWSFGATLFHAVCGRPPFNGASAAEVLSSVLYARVPDPVECEPTLSNWLALVLRKCLTRDPVGRYQDPHELLLDLERVRERRAPRIRRRSLDPVQRKDDGRQRVLLVGGISLALVVLASAAFLPRLLRRAEPAADVASEPGPYAQLDELAARRSSGLGRPAELLAELKELEPHVPARDRVRYEELVRGVDEDLRRCVRALRTEIEDEVDREIEAGDLEAGWRTLGDEIEPRFLRLTGYGLEGLSRVGVNLEAWRERIALTLRAATETAVSELEAQLQDWRFRRLAQVEASLAQQDWERAFDALRLPESSQMFAQAGFTLTLPAATKAGLLDGLAVEFRLRSERLQDDWQRLDHELKIFVSTRTATLERTLREGPPRIPAERMLRKDFERELFDRRLSREKMPAGLSRAGLEELEARAQALAALEEQMLEEDARSDFAEVEELAGAALRRRDYERALGLWEEAAARLASGARFESSVARAELARRMEVRRTEASLLDQLLERVAERVRALDGSAIELRWGSITYPRVRILAGSDPRHLGFTAESIAGRLYLADLPSLQFEAFAALGREADLAPEERLELALFRFREGRAQDAQRVLFSGALPDAPPASEVCADLAGRIAGALEQRDQRDGAREGAARRLFDSVMDPSYQALSTRVALARIARLLDEFADLPLVKQQRGELLKLRTSLEAKAPTDQIEFERAYAPGDLDLETLGRVTLGYDFSEGKVGAFELGQWAFDGLGLILGPEGEVASWDELAAERGLRLYLKPPLVPDSLELSLRFEALQGEVPARLLWITLAGFQILVSAPELPGAMAGPQFLVGTEENSGFLQRFLAGEGKRAETLLVPGGPPRELRLRAWRRSGRCELYLDDVLLASHAGLKAPPSDARSLLLRSWGGVRVQHLTIEGGR